MEPKTDQKTPAELSWLPQTKLCDYCDNRAYHRATETTGQKRSFRLCQGHVSIFSFHGWLVDKAIEEIKAEEETTKTIYKEELRITVVRIETKEAK